MGVSDRPIQHIIEDNEGLAAECGRLQSELTAAKAEIDRLRGRVVDLENSEAHYWWKLGMANARRLIKANKSTSNASLFMNLFGTGFGTARARCVEIGLDPESNESSLNVMAQRLRQQADEANRD